MNTAIRAAYDRVRRAERELEALVREVYQIGDTVSYALGDHHITAAVLGHSGTRIKVRGLNSGKEYWISAYRVTP